MSEVEVSVNIIREFERAKVARTAKLQGVVDTSVSHKTSLREGQWRVHHVLSRGHCMDQENLQMSVSPDQEVGDRPVDVYIHAEDKEVDFSIQLKDLNREVKGLKKVAVRHLKADVKSTAYSVLLPLYDANALSASSRSNRIRDLCTQNTNVGAAFVKEFGGSLPVIIRGLDGVITARNSHMHFSDQRSLDDAVEACLSNVEELDAVKEIQKDMPWKYCVLQHHTFIKQFYV